MMTTPLISHDAQVRLRYLYRSAIRTDGESTVRLEKKLNPDGTLLIQAGVVKPGADFVPSWYDLDVVTEETAIAYIAGCGVFWEYLCVLPINVPLDVRE